SRVIDAMSILQLAGAPDEDLWIAGYEEVVSQHWLPFDDVAPLLAALDERGIAYGAATNNVTHYQRLKLAQTGLAFDVVIDTDIRGKQKTDPLTFVVVVRQLVATGDNTYMNVDHAINDVQDAQDEVLID